MKALIEGRDAIEHIEIYGMIHFWTDQIIKKNLENKLKLNPFMMNRYTVEGFQKGFADYIPCRYSKIPELFHKGHVPLDAALISVSSPDSEGNCTYGVSSDYAWP
ncbi:hypothetical protein C6A37_02990 [Desulfobacteraceae bacterium SEEP-SAG9]|nr:hypothetical protein C6A37_02990 [Desulfobacteraceae bacterium SEEP-SAG9]